MKIKPVTLINIILSTVLLTSIVFSVTTENTGSSVQYPYDPWEDINDDGVINIYDVVQVCNSYGATGTPINKTALLLELLDRIKTLEDRVTALEENVTAFACMHEARINELEMNITMLETMVDTLNTTVVEHEFRMNSLNASYFDLLTRVGELEAKNLTQFIGRPAYDSGWVKLLIEEETPFEHNLNTTNVLVYIIGSKYSTGLDPHQHAYGGWADTNVGWDKYEGVWWHDLTTTHIKVFRTRDDDVLDNQYPWNYVRVMMWKIKNLLLQDLPS